MLMILLRFIPLTEQLLCLHCPEKLCCAVFSNASKKDSCVIHTCHEKAHEPWLAPEGCA